MKKFVAVIAVLAVAMLSSVAMAEVTISGSIEIRSLSLNNTDTVYDEPGQQADRNRTTQERVRINLDAKNDGVKGRITVENDWDVWGRIEQPQANGQTPTSTANSGLGRLELREAWLDFVIPGAGPAHVKVGHQFLQLGNGWLVRHQKYGSDAWLVGYPGKNTVAFVDVKAAENGNGTTDDIDAYVLLDNYKIDDNNTVGVYLMRINSPRGVGFSPYIEANLDTLGLWYAGKVAGINVKFEYDKQMGSAKAATGGTDLKFKGSQFILEGDMAFGAASANLLFASGSGDKANSPNEMGNIVTSLDADPHYTFVYEYFAKTACGVKNSGFCNTQAIAIGGSYEVTKWFGVDLKYFMLSANEKVALNGNATLSDDLGTEIDARLRFKLYDNLTWNWTFGRLMAGDAYKNAANHVKDVDAIQGILSYKF